MLLFEIDRHFQSHRMKLLFCRFACEPFLDCILFDLINLIISRVEVVCQPRKRLMGYTTGMPITKSNFIYGLPKLHHFVVDLLNPVYDAALNLKRP